MLGSDQVRERGKRKWLDSGYILKTELVVRFEVGYSSRWRADTWGGKRTFGGGKDEPESFGCEECQILSVSMLGARQSRDPDLGAPRRREIPRDGGWGEAWSCFPVSRTPRSAPCESSGLLLFTLGINMVWGGPGGMQGREGGGDASLCVPCSVSTCPRCGMCKCVSETHHLSESRSHITFPDSQIEFGSPAMPRPCHLCGTLGTHMSPRHFSPLQVCFGRWLDLSFGLPSGLSTPAGQDPLVCLFVCFSFFFTDM